MCIYTRSYTIYTSMSSLQQCDTFFDDPPRLAGMGYGRLVSAAVFFILAASTVTFLLYQRRTASALLASSAGQAGGSSSTIFPAFEKFLYLLVLVNIFTGVLILSTTYEVGRDWSTAGFLFTFAVAMQHVVCEGIAFMLMQKGCGYYAFKKAGFYAIVWGGICYMFLVYTAFHNEGAFMVFMVWNALVWLFYLSLWFVPMDYLFRRPGAILFAKIFSVYHGLLFVIIMYENYFTNDSVPCVYFFNTLFLEPLLQPIFAYYILLEDSRWWQGLGVFSKAATMSDIQTVSPLHGFDMCLQSATTLAKVVDHMGGAATATLISFSQISYDKKNLIGYGSFSKVYKGKFKAKECAIKLVYTMDLTEEDICRVAAEATILSSVNSLNVVNIFGVTVLPPSVCVVLELCAYGSLSDVLRYPKALTLSFQDQLFLCLGCAKGVAALHALNNFVVHRDIKSFNFLVDNQLNAKLADLELGSNTDDKFEIKNIDDNSLFDSDFLANWIAPEVLQQAPYTQASDIYAMSLVFWEIFSKEIPFSEKNNQSTRDAIINNLRPDLEHAGFQHCPEIFRNLIVAGWSNEPLVRPVADDFVSVIESIWLTHGVTGLSILESKSEDIMNKLIVADAVMKSNDTLKSDTPTIHGNNTRLIAIAPLYELFEAIENNDLWKICSLEWEQLTGYLNEHLIGYNMRDLLSAKTKTAGSADPSVVESYEIFLNSLKTSQAGHCVVTIRTPTGTDVTISLHASPIFKSLYERSTSEDGQRSSMSWSGAVPYARTIAFYKLTATVLTQIDDYDAENLDGEEDNNIFSKILRKLSFDGGSNSILPHKNRRSGHGSSSRGSGRSSGRTSASNRDSRGSGVRTSYMSRDSSRSSSGTGRSESDGGGLDFGVGSVGARSKSTTHDEVGRSSISSDNNYIDRISSSYGGSSNVLSTLCADHTRNTRTDSDLFIEEGTRTRSASEVELSFV